ncbi:MAG: aldehyde dehydrogenase family protein [Acidimicrobiia bacterium]
MSRIAVKKTHKLYIGGGFPRSESGRSYPVGDASGEVVARVAWASRKDLRDAVRAARSAQPGWAGKTAYNRGQVLYRIAEMIEDRAAVFAEQVAYTGASEADARAEVDTAIDSTVWYAGWADKFAQIHGNLNPVAGPFFNISTPEPSGVIGVVAPPEPSLLGLIHRLLPVIVSGNSAVVVASEPWPIPAVSLSEVLATSDMPGGVVNLLTGPAAELTPFLAGHMDVDGIDLTGADAELATAATFSAAENVKRVVVRRDPLDRSPYFIADFTETKTVWHPKGL